MVRRFRTMSSKTAIPISTRFSIWSASISPTIIDDLRPADAPNFPGWETNVLTNGAVDFGFDLDLTAGDDFLRTGQGDDIVRAGEGDDTVEGFRGQRDPLCGQRDVARRLQPGQRSGVLRAQHDPVEMGGAGGFRPRSGQPGLAALARRLNQTSRRCDAPSTTQGCRKIYNDSACGCWTARTGNA